jgi:CRP-like cAMP-binding protein
MSAGKTTTIQGLDAEAREALLSVAATRRFAPQETLCTEGDDAESMMLIEEGTAVATRFAANGKEAILAFFGPGDLIGEIGCLGDLPRSATVTAVAAVTAKVIPRGEVKALMRRAPEVALGVIAVLCARLYETDALVMSLSALRMRGRLASGLLQLARKHGETRTRGVYLTVALTQREIGAYVGLSRENVSRILAEWRQAAILSIDADNAITLRDLDKLEEIAIDDA